MSASMKLTAWWLMMAVPKVFLSVAYLVASSRALWLIPTAPAATGGRVLSKAPMATLNPAPSPMSTFSLGLPEDRPGVLSSSIVVGSHRDDLVLSELLRQVQVLLLLLGDGEVETHRLGGCCGLGSIGEAPSSWLCSLSEQSCDSCGCHCDGEESSFQHGYCSPTVPM